MRTTTTYARQPIITSVIVATAMAALTAGAEAASFSGAVLVESNGKYVNCASCSYIAFDTTGAIVANGFTNASGNYTVSGIIANKPYIVVGGRVAEASCHAGAWDTKWNAVVRKANYSSVGPVYAKHWEGISIYRWAYLTPQLVYPTGQEEGLDYDPVSEALFACENCLEVKHDLGRAGFIVGFNLSSSIALKAAAPHGGWHIWGDNTKAPLDHFFVAWESEGRVSLAWTFRTCDTWEADHYKEGSEENGPPLESFSIIPKAR